MYISFLSRFDPKKVNRTVKLQTTIPNKKA